MTGIAMKRSGAERLLRSLLTHKVGLIGAVIVLTAIILAVAAPYIAPFEPGQRHLAHRFTPPIWVEGGRDGYLLGTDQHGRDILSRIMFGARISLVVGVAAVVLSSVVGLLLGLASGFAGGILDIVIMRTVDAMLAIPTILFMLVIVLVVGSGLWPLIAVIGATNWVSYTKLVRGEVLSVRERDYVKAARAGGAGLPRILHRHIIPNIFSAFVVISTLNVGSVILAESSLSFLGLGIQPPDLSWGQMLSDGRQYLATSWWIATFPGLAITITVLGIMFLGDWLRDYLDPRLP